MEICPGEFLTRHVNREFADESQGKRLQPGARIPALERLQNKRRRPVTALLLPLKIAILYRLSISECEHRSRGPLKADSDSATLRIEYQDNGIQSLSHLQP